MPTIKDKLYFNFDGLDSSNFKLIHINTSGGMFEDILVSNRDLNETKVRGSDTSYVNHVEDSAIEFELNLAFTEDFTRADVDNIIRWLFVDHFKPLYFVGEENRLFYCMPVGEASIAHNGLMQGYFTLTMRCNSNFVFSPVILSQLYDLSDGLMETIGIYNDGHTIAHPEISIKKIGIGNVTIASRTDGGKIFEIRDLTDQEDIYIHCKKEIIDTDVIGATRYDNAIGDFPRLLYGNNKFEVTGTCQIQFRYQFKYRF